MLDQDCLSFVELFVKNGKLGLDAEVVNTLSLNHLVELAEIVSAGHVTKGSVTALSNIEVLLLEGKLSESLPVGFSLICDVKRFKDINSGFETTVHERSTELN